MWWWESNIYNKVNIRIRGIEKKIAVLYQQNLSEVHDIALYIFYFLKARAYYRTWVWSIVEANFYERNFSSINLKTIFFIVHFQGTENLG